MEPFFKIKKDKEDAFFNYNNLDKSPHDGVYWIDKEKNYSIILVQRNNYIFIDVDSDGTEYICLDKVLLKFLDWYEQGFIEKV